MAALIKHVGRGARLAKDLGLEDARTAMRMIASGAATPAQIGAFLLAMRVKGENAEELAGFTLALRELSHVSPPPLEGPLVDVDLHGDGREGRPSLMLAAACVAAACGARVVVRGAFGQAFARNDLDGAFAALGIDVADTAGAMRSLAGAGVAVIDLESYAPRIASLLALREELGVRTCVHSAVKLLDPFGARRALVGIFHGPYHAPVAGAARLLGAKRAVVIQGPGGLPEIAPDKPSRVTLVDADAPPAEGPVTLPPPGADPPPDAADIPGLIRAVLAGDAPPGATAMTVATAAQMLWAAGIAGADPAAALRSGAARRVFDVIRACYTG